MKKLSLQWRITLMTFLLLTVACVTMKTLLCSSGHAHMDSIGSYVLHYADEEPQSIRIDMPEEQWKDVSQRFAGEFVVELTGVKHSFCMTGWYIALPGAISQGLIWGVMAIGVYITYKILDIADLTVDGSFCTGGAVCVMMIAGGCNVWLALLCAILAGMLTGLATGLLHTACGIPAILAGILTQLGLWSVNLAIMGMKANQALNVNKQPLLVSLRYLQEVAKGTRPFYMHPIFIVGLFVLAIIAILYWFFGTELGSSIRATGANLHMSRAQGINTNKNIVLGLMISNGLVALSGALLSQYQSFADINMGRGAIVIGLAAVIIGEALFGKLFRNFALKLLAVAIGSVIYYAVIQAVVSLSGINSNYLKLLSALIVAVFLTVPHWKAKYFTKKRVTGGKSHA